MVRSELAISMLDLVDGMRLAILEIVFPVKPSGQHWCKCRKCGKWHRINS